MNPLPCWIRTCLLTCACLLTVCCYIITFAQEQCFEPYDISDSIAVQLGGDPFNVVKPLGWYCAYLLLAGCLPLLLYQLWRQCRLYTYYRESHHAKQNR